MVERIAVIGYQTTEETGIATSRSMTEEIAAMYHRMTGGIATSRSMTGGIAATYRQMTGGTENR